MMYFILLYRLANCFCSFVNRTETKIIRIMIKRKIAIGITGASGAIYAKVLIEKLKKLDNVELSLVMSENAKDVWKFELGNDD